MAILTLDRIWLTPVADPASGMAFSLNAVEYDPVIDMSSEQRADGGFDALSTPGMQMVAKVTLNFATDVQKATLKGWLAAGTPLCLRTPDSEKFYGVIQPGATFTPRPIGDSWAIPFTVAEFSYSEAV